MNNYKFRVTYRRMVSDKLVEQWFNTLSDAQAFEAMMTAMGCTNVKLKKVEA